MMSRPGKSWSPPPKRRIPTTSAKRSERRVTGTRASSSLAVAVSAIGCSLFVLRVPREGYVRRRKTGLYRRPRKRPPLAVMGHVHWRDVRLLLYEKPRWHLIFLRLHKIRLCVLG